MFRKEGKFEEDPQPLLELRRNSWMVGFLDLILLLLAFFILLFTMVQIPTSQWEDIQKSLKKAFQASIIDREISLEVSQDIAIEFPSTSLSYLKEILLKKLLLLQENPSYLLDENYRLIIPLDFQYQQDIISLSEIAHDIENRVYFAVLSDISPKDFQQALQRRDAFFSFSIGQYNINMAFLSKTKIKQEILKKYNFYVIFYATR